MKLWTFFQVSKHSLCGSVLKEQLQPGMPVIPNHQEWVESLRKIEDPPFSMLLYHVYLFARRSSRNKAVPHNSLTMHYTTKFINIRDRHGICSLYLFIYFFFSTFAQNYFFVSLQEFREKKSIFYTLVVNIEKRVTENQTANLKICHYFFNKVITKEYGVRKYDSLMRLWGPRQTPSIGQPILIKRMGSNILEHVLTGIILYLF